MEKITYIYESPDGGKTIYRRKFNDYSKRQKINNMEKLNNDHRNRSYPFWTTRTHYKVANKSRFLEKQIEYLKSKNPNNDGNNNIL